ncbi:response regulator transcription factor [Hahella sp. CR1]|uniref:response regulator transcription factor n=1 Tax=Hahella sp. CR1 TaxID=2992807 RepID=UPI002441A768|nr:response regulator transcription factor [Hahella sp. CR1]MDG9670859.1 response regulator transcription factor [Hahella sp. CR1]
MINILIADDHEIVIRGLKDLLQSEFSEIEIGTACNHNELISQLALRQWNLILLDIVMPEMNVIDMLTQIRHSNPDVPVLILTAISETEYAVRTLSAGANGYITKQQAANELIEAVHSVLAGGTYLSKEAVIALAADLKKEKPCNPHERLSSRELEVFCMIAKGKTIKEVAYELSVSAKTISTYVMRIREKTGLENYVDIARYALLHKLVD